MSKKYATVRKCFSGKIIFTIFSVLVVSGCTNEAEKFTGTSESLRVVLSDVKKGERQVSFTELDDAIAIVTEGAVTVNSSAGTVLTESTVYSSGPLAGMTPEQVVLHAQTDSVLARETLHKRPSCSAI